MNQKKKEENKGEEKVKKALAEMTVGMEDCVQTLQVRDTKLPPHSYLC